MRRKMLSLVIMSLCLLAFAPMAMAGYTVQLLAASPFNSGVGGEFTFTTGGLPLSGYVSGTTIASNGSTFQTFCIEYNEHISWGGSYTAELSNVAKYGGVSGGSPDPISIGTAYLYSQFAKGSLSIYSYSGSTADRKASAGALQQAFWMLEGETPVASNAYITLAETALTLGWTDLVKDAPIGKYGVQVLNLYYGSTYAQDQLVVTPIPSAVWLLGSGLLGLVGLRRRFLL